MWSILDSRSSRAAQTTIVVFAVLLVAAGGGGVSTTCAQGTDAPATVIALRSAPLLFADDGGVAHRVNISRTVHPAQTRREPVLVADQPWEHLRVYMWGTVHRDSESGKLAMWYMSRPPPPLTGTRNLYAVSDDGLRWTKPALGVYEFNGSKQNNMLGVGGGSLAVLHDPIDPNPNRRYKRFAHRSGGYFAAYSADGIRWTEDGGRPVLTAGDTITLAQNPTTGEYLAFHKRPHRSGAFDVRVVWLARSRDFKTWSEPQLVLAADEADQDWATQPAERTEIYDMAVFPHAAGYLGFPAVFRNKPQVITPELREAGAVAADGPLDIQLATSENGDRWRRSWPRVAVIPRGAPGTFDGGAILGVACAPVHTAKETWVYYSAISATHGAPVPPKTMTIGRAEWRRHGFVSADAGPQGGEIETKPLHFETPSLVCNADASRGELRVALLEADGRAIAGRGFDECTPLRADETRWVVAWGGKDAVPTDRPLRVMVKMKNVRLFSLESGAPAR
jgi:hypothetical protein